MRQTREELKLTTTSLQAQDTRESSIIGYEPEVEERWKLDNSPALQRSWMDRPSSGSPAAADLCGRDGTVVRLLTFCLAQ